MHLWHVAQAMEVAVAGLAVAAYTDRQKQGIRKQKREGIHLLPAPRRGMFRAHGSQRQPTRPMAVCVVVA